MIPNILSIAGSDCSGGAGIQADIKAISANGGYAMSVITALTAQNTQGVRSVHLAPLPMIADQIAAIRDDITIHAVKIGMLGTAGIVRCVAEGLAGLDCPIVLDPVMVAKGGDRLLATEAVAALREVLLPRVTLVTPNLPEAADLLGQPEAGNCDEMRRQARAILSLGPGAVMLKGGHLAGATSPDLLIAGEAELWLRAPRVETANTHGTGCTLSSTLATLLGRGLPLPRAAEDAKAYITAAIAAADRLSVGRGHGPVHHFHAFHGDPS
ncbi:MAG TPA: bifunctional hydroxymethylpyrimidine kinase/phosphomethylpyrimidine kinase [Paracoccus sp. (in: a-proteobacteria)]|uniref:bifunctional hydroxymethylpyrimidine kinase/phosphomethylpyrimidine kinase n=1 Tax=uncultured Paracoccus sp. TaxID=189685 RepID=UPI0026311373|nr:bifunctional hydroxymethylpyrimidine kinase/phosphomethylpyrimidine kinase [uncultured Paracoccus sp.]HMQ40318.1 bifunctional hydroxymethylpyrimidine kinase/phosphomethylpyrimidine kinase [Paracoccus sp. (in: a-proteobacteria)]HMR34887.1 bifunctional hydroxymethylpyrimidine kinase/phosphomethylpyrimidine kinase [Paracoccus sp. (in: a-proteobacteria)]